MFIHVNFHPHLTFMLTTIEWHIFIFSNNATTGHYKNYNGFCISTFKNSWWMWWRFELLHFTHNHKDVFNFFSQLMWTSCKCRPRLHAKNALFYKQKMHPKLSFSLHLHIISPVLLPNIGNTFYNNHNFLNCRSKNISGWII